MLRLLQLIPNNSYIACSGGVDSMVMCDFMLGSKKKFTIVHVHHGTKHADDAYNFVKSFAQKNDIPLIVKKIKSYQESNTEKSCEEYWRDERYKLFHSLEGKVVTGHHLDDAVEWWVFSSLHGKSKLIPIENKNVIRPLLITEKSKILNWAVRKNIQHVTDPSNKEIKYRRNLIRHKLLPHVLQVNPGIRKVIKKKYLSIKNNEQR